ncbi:MAG TPA: UdgX family uracil-DNA binding protein [Steroidobacteraceae bacterium]
MIDRRFTFETWRDTARPWLAAGHKADEIRWLETASELTERATAGVEAGSMPRTPHELRLPRPLMLLLENLAYFRHDSRWELMYRLAWRVLYENPQLLADPAEPDVANAMSMDRAVRRDIHKMHAFVRFREIVTEGGESSYFAWFEPQHEILRPGAKFFVKRFPNMRWTIATPDGAAVWDKASLQFVAPQFAGERPANDAQEDLWRTYYHCICNVARINPTAMQREMPKHYWRNLPEATEIPALMKHGGAKFAARHTESDHENFTGARSLRRSLDQLHVPVEGVQTCRACDIWKNATQAVEGEGPPSAKLMLVGEQPGDEEDLQGRPFVGPAGKVLNDALTAAGIQRSEIYITNAVKHFKWEARGKRRLHKKPSSGEIRICNVWLRKEIETTKPTVIVALGASALSALHGSSFSIEAARHLDLTHPAGARILATFHPSAILRAEGERAPILRTALVEDLKRASRLVPTPT